MALNASFIADFSSFMDATTAAVTAMQGFKQSAEQLGPGIDRGLEDTLKVYEQVGRQTRQLGADAIAASKTFIDAFAEEQDAVNRLTSALEANGQATPNVTAAYSELASQFQNTTKYADEAIINTEAILTSIGQVGPEQMELALHAVTNLASGMKIDLNSAATMVAKAFASGGENLGKLKAVLGDSIQPGQDAAAMLEAINTKFGPAAQNELKTYNGQIAHMNNQMSDLQEQVGGVLVQTLTDLLGVFRALPEGVQTFTLAVVAIGGVLAPVLVSLSSLVSLLSTTGLGAGIVSAFTSISAFLGPAGWIAIGVVALAAIIYKNWDAITAATQRLYEGVKHWLLDKFTALVEAIKAPIQGVVGAFQYLYNTVVGHSIVPDLIRDVGKEFGRLDTAMVQPVAAAAGAARDQFAGLQEDVAASSSAMRDYLALLKYSNQANAILSRNSLFTSHAQREALAALPLPAFGTGGHGGGVAGSGGNAAAVAVYNTFNLVDTESNLARKVSDLIMQTIRAGSQLST